MERSNKFQNVLIVMLTVAVVAMAVGFATYTANLQINGNATFAAAKWDIHFANYGTTGNSDATITNVTTADTTITFDVALDPGKVYEFTVDAVNAGTFDAKLSSVTISPATASSVGTGYRTFEVWYDNTACSGTTCSSAIGTTLAKNGGTKQIKVKVAYPLLEQSIVSQYPSTAETETYTISFKSVDADSYTGN